MIKISELLHQKEEKYQKARSILVKACDVEKRNLTPEEDTSYRVLEGEIEALRLQIEQETRSQALEMESVRSSSDLTPPPGFEGESLQRRTMGKVSYRSLFGPPSGGMGGFKDAEEFYRVVASGRHDPRLVTRSFVEGDPSSAGFLIPEQIAAPMMDTVIEKSIVLPRAQVFSMTGPTRRVPAWDVSDSSDLFGGLSGSWSGEAVTGTKVKGKVRQILLTAKKLQLFTDSSNELLDDATGFQSQVESVVTKSLSWGMDVAFLRGLGSGQPLGALLAPSLVVVPKDTGQLAKTLSYDNVLAMYARLHPACDANSIWLLNRTCVPQLYSMALTLGVGAAPVYSPQGGAGWGTLLSRPIVISEKMPVIGSQGDICLVDFSQYACGLRKEIFIDRTNAIGWMDDKTDWRGTVRCDGMPAWDKAISPLYGDSLSWIVALAERS